MTGTKFSQLALQIWLTLPFFTLYAWPQEEREHRLLYVVAEALPKNYSWQFSDKPFSHLVWVGYRFNSQGKLQYKEAPRLKKLLTQRREKQYLLLSLENVSVGKKLLLNPAVAQHSRQQVLNLLTTYPQISGIQFDFEYLPAELATNYTLYIQQMRTFLPPKIEIQVAVFPPLDFPQQYRNFHDLPALVQVADSLVVMLYDRHRPGTPPGCVTPISWLNANIEELSKLPTPKVWLGAPLYGYWFFANKTKAISKKTFENIPAVAHYRDGCLFKEAMAGSLAFYPASELYGVYYTLYKKYRFAGLAFWRAGWEQ